MSWVRNYLPQMDGDNRVAEILHYYYERYDPACKSPYELEAISSKYLGKEDKLYESLEEKYGENPMVVYNSIQDYGKRPESLFFSFFLMRQLLLFPPV